MGKLKTVDVLPSNRGLFAVANPAVGTGPELCSEADGIKFSL